MQHEIFYAYLFSLLSCYGIFSWSAMSFFENKEISYQKLFTSLKIMSIIFWTTSLVIIYKKTSFESLNLLLSLLVNSFCIILFFWASKAVKNMNFSAIYGKDIPDKVCTNGPFKYIRNPFYASYLLCYLTAIFTLQSLLLGLEFITLLVLYLIAIKIEENKFLHSPDFKAYVKYRNNTGALFPRIIKKK